jgi:hypothetical protein
MASPGPLSLSPEIDDLRRQFEQISSDADEIVAPLNEGQFSWRPSPDVWSVADCLEHMNATARFYLPALDEGIADAIRHGAYGEGPFEYNWLGRAFARFIEPPSRLRMKAGPHTQPGPERPKRETLAGFRAYQVQYIDRLRQANGIDLARARARSPFVTWIRIPLGSAFAAMAAHERRHVWQLRRLTSMAGFPAS